MSAIVTGFIIDVLQNKGTKAAHLVVLEHCLHTVRDEAEYKDVFDEAAHRVGCDAARLKEVLNAIAGAAHDLRSPI